MKFYYARGRKLRPVEDHRRHYSTLASTPLSWNLIPDSHHDPQQGDRPRGPHSTWRAQQHGKARNPLLAPHPADLGRQLPNSPPAQPIPFSQMHCRDTLGRLCRQTTHPTIPSPGRTSCSHQSYTQRLDLPRRSPHISLMLAPARQAGQTNWPFDRWITWRAARCH